MTAVFVTGHRGMLGSTVSRYLAERGHDVLVTTTRFAGSRDDPLVAEIASFRAEVVVNCAGVVTQDTGPAMMLTNAVLPVQLAAVLSGRRLIQPSTDCVFDGRRGWYNVTETPNATDHYGLSKRLGEACATFEEVYVLRTSIVGLPAAGGRGLLGWYLGQGGPVDGYLDHAWNGITTLAWAKEAVGIIEGNWSLPPGVSQPTTADPISKYALLRLFGRVFDHPLKVRAVETGAVDRTLVPTVTVAPIREQLAELRDWA